MHEREFNSKKTRAVIFVVVYCHHEFLTCEVLISVTAEKVQARHRSSTISANTVAGARDRTESKPRTGTALKSLHFPQVWLLQAVSYSLRLPVNVYLVFLSVLFFNRYLCLSLLVL